MGHTYTSLLTHIIFSTRDRFPSLDTDIRDEVEFAWQTGYGAFSVSRSSVDDVVRYIANQEEHHRKKTFQEEYIELLTTHGIEYDERYIWS